MIVNLESASPIIEVSPQSSVNSIETTDDNNDNILPSLNFIEMDQDFTLFVIKHYENFEKNINEDSIFIPLANDINEESTSKEIWNKKCNKKHKSNS